MRAVALCLLPSVWLLACGTDGPIKLRSDDGGAADHPADGLATVDMGGLGDVAGEVRRDTAADADALDASPDQSDGPADRLADTTSVGGRDGGAGGSVGSGGAGLGGFVGMGGAGLGGFVGTGGAGLGGATAGLGGAAGSNDDGGSAGDAGTNTDGGSNGPDLPADTQPGSEAGTEGGTDAGPTCGEGCPATVEPQALVLWVSADVGVTCDQGNPARVVGWQDRRAGSTLILSPAAGRLGPRCDGQVLAGHALPYFDKPTTNVDDAVLPVSLSALNGNSYTVFVVERRRSADARYILGTDVPSPASFNGCVSDNAHLAYRLGYRSGVLFGGGSFTYDVDDESCLDPTTTVPAFATPAAVLSIERLVAGSAHTITYAAQAPATSVDTAPMTSLPQGYLGRGYQLAVGTDSRYLGELAEVVIYGVALTPTEVGSVSTYLRTRWGL